MPNNSDRQLAEKIVMELLPPSVLTTNNAARRDAEVIIEDFIAAHRDTLLAPVRELVKEFREATVGIGNYATMRPLNEIEKAIARACADRLTAVLGERKEGGQ